MKLSDPVGTIPGVGHWSLYKLKALGIETVKDLIGHYPSRWQDYSLNSDITLLQGGEVATVQGQITSIQNLYLRSGKRIQKATVSDGSTSLDVTWFNQPYLVKTLPVGTWVSLSGKVKAYGRKKTLVAPEYEKITNYKLQITNSETLHTGRLVPIYPETSGLSSKWIRSKIAYALPQVIDEIEEYLARDLREKNNLVDLKKALKDIHFPASDKEAQGARRRLAFDEFFDIQLTCLYRKKIWKEKIEAHALSVDWSKIKKFIQNLPFSLTEAQKRATREILTDLQKLQAMNRLLEGDVGSGKTVVAAVAALTTYLNGLQTAIMAPTQILALQHFNTLKSLLQPFEVDVKLRIHGVKLTDKFDVLVGTHALVHKSSDFSKLGLVVIDEQHRFGVEQRAILAQKGKQASPHVLTMTATPIPRTVALTLYGDLDLSILDEMPAGRRKVKTWVVPSQKRQAAYQWIRKQVQNTDEQAFIVCPLIEESEKETMKSVKAATKEFERLSREVFPDLSLALLHGRMKAKEKQEIMQKMKEGKIDILLATPVVEVGIDIPTATIMMVETAERFGLAQLHQLRGRVGRSDKQAYCLLFTDLWNPKVIRRLKSLESIYSGPVLAELDLKLRGPGEIYGTAQSGFPELRIGSFADSELIHLAREAAEEMLKQPKNKIVEKFIKSHSTIAPN